MLSSFVEGSSPLTRVLRGLSQFRNHMDWTFRSCIRACTHRQATSYRIRYKSQTWTFVIKSTFNYLNSNSISKNHLIKLHVFKFHLISHLRRSTSRSLMCARLKKEGEKEYCHGWTRIPPITRIQWIFLGPWKSLEEIRETLFSSDKLCRATERKTG